MFRAFVFGGFLAIVVVGTVRAADKASDPVAAQAENCAGQNDNGGDCAEISISSLDADITKTYSGLIASLSAEDAAALKEDQDAFMRGRKLVSGLDAYTLPEFLSSRLSFLNAIVPAPESYAGYWQNEFGMTEVKARSGGKYDVVVETTDPVGGLWLCRFNGEGTVKDGKLLVVHEGEPDPKDWTLDVSRQGGRLIVAAKPGAETPKGEVFPYCGRAGRVDFNYFPAKNSAS